MASLARLDAGVGEHPAQVHDQLPVDVLAVGRLQDLGVAAELALTLPLGSWVVVPTASSSDSTWRHSTLPLNGWLKIFSSVTRWWWLRSAAMRRPPQGCVVTGYPHGRGRRRSPPPVMWFSPYRSPPATRDCGPAVADRATRPTLTNPSIPAPCPPYFRSGPHPSRAAS